MIHKSGARICIFVGICVLRLHEQKAKLLSHSVSNAYHTFMQNTSSQQERILPSKQYRKTLMLMCSDPVSSKSHLSSDICARCQIKMTDVGVMFTLKLKHHQKK